MLGFARSGRLGALVSRSDTVTNFTGVREGATPTRNTPSMQERKDEL